MLQLTLANKQVAITQLFFQRWQKPWHPKYLYKKNTYLFYSISKALIYATVIIAILGDYIEPVLQEESKVNNP